MTDFSTRIQRWCSYSGTAGRDDLFYGGIVRLIAAVPYFLIGIVFLSGSGFEPDTPQGMIGIHIWMIPYQLFWNFPLVMRRWRDLNGKLHARWLMVYFLYCLLPELGDLTDDRLLTITGYMISIVNLYPIVILTFARGEKWKRIYRDKKSTKSEIITVNLQ